MALAHEDIFNKLALLGTKHPNMTATEVAKRVAEQEAAMQAMFDKLAGSGKWPKDGGWDMGKAIPQQDPDFAKPKPLPFDLAAASNRQAMICMRLHCRPEDFPFKHFATIYANEVVYVTIVIGKEAIMFEDPAVEFPSDTLMAQLRLVAP